MADVLAVLLWVILALCGVMKRKYSKVYAVILFLYIAAAYGLNTDTPDYASYKYIYEISGDISAYTNTEAGYRFICHIFHAAGFSFEQFRFLYGCLNALVFVKSVQRLTPYSSSVLGMFLVFPFIGSISGLRFSMASAIVLYCIPYLTEGKKGYVKYIIGVLSAALLHMTVLFYLVFLFAVKKYNRNQYIKIGAGIMLVSVLIKSEIIVIIAKRFAAGHLLHKITRWLSFRENTGIHHPEGIRLAVHIIIIILLFFLVNEISKILIREMQNEMSGESDSDSMYHLNKKRKSITLYRNIAACLLLIIPAFIISAEYQRLLTGILPVYYAVYSEFRYKGIYMDAGNRKMYLFLSYASAGMYLIFFMVTNRGNFDFAGALSNNFIWETLERL